MPLRLAALARAIRFPALAGLLIYCSAPPAPPAPNQIPLAAAGTDQQVALEEEVSVDGSLSSDPEGAALGFTWRAAVENPVAIVFPETLPRFSFVATVPGTYIFILSVSDGTLTSNPDSVRIAVASPDNQAPTADAGPDLVVGANSPIPLSGLGSNDPDGDPLSYQWTVLAAPMEIQLVDATARQTTFTPTESGDYRFRLTVNDGELSASDQVTVLVRDSGNQVPTADAGPDQQVAVGDLVTLDGTLSASLDSADGGATILYHWIVGSAPGGTIALSDSTAAQPTFIAADPGDYIFGLEVSDRDLTSLLDVVTIRVLERIFNEQSGMVEIPAGAFIMGSDQGAPDESPPHRVELGLYWIDKFEATTDQYQACVAAGVCSESALSAGCNSARDDRLEHPVNCVTYDQAGTYCLWRAKRLPTEAEWEKAARGDDGRLYPWGEDFPSTQLLNYNDNIGSTTAVGSYPLGASFYSLHNMGGNVQEWTADYFAGDYYAQSPDHDPQGPDDGSLRVVRGASWKLGVPLEVLTTTVRGAFVPSTVDNSVGFRCASDLAPAP